MSTHDTPPIDPEQLTPEDDLMDVNDPNADFLDTGYSVPDREPAAARIQQKVNDGDLSEMDAALEAETPEAWEETQAPDTRRAGRLEDEVIDGREQDVQAKDVGEDGGAASAEEAAMHVTDDQR